MTKLWVSAGLEVKKGINVSVVLAALLVLEEATVKEPGCFKFEVLHDIEHPNKIILWECWTDEAALADHYAAPHTVHYLSLDYTAVAYISRLVMNKPQG